MRIKTTTSCKTVNEQVEGRWLGNDYVDTKQTTKVSANASATKNQIDWKKWPWPSDRANELALQESGKDVSVWGPRNKVLANGFFICDMKCENLCAQLQRTVFDLTPTKPCSLPLCLSIVHLLLVHVFFSYSSVCKHIVHVLDTQYCTSMPRSSWNRDTVHAVWCAKIICCLCTSTVHFIGAEIRRLSSVSQSILCTINLNYASSVGLSLSRKLYSLIFLSTRR